MGGGARLLLRYASSVQLLSAQRCHEACARQRLLRLLVYLMDFDDVASGIVEEHLMPLVHE